MPLSEATGWGRPRLWGAANERINNLATNLERETASLKEERGRLKTALSESNRRLARLDLERGRTAFEKCQ